MKRHLEASAAVALTLFLATCGPQSSTVPVGDTGRIAVKSGGISKVYAVVQKGSFDLLYNTLSAGDSVGLANLLARGIIFPIDVGAHVRVIDSSFTMRKIRVETGKSVGNAGWVPNEWVK